MGIGDSHQTAQCVSPGGGVAIHAHRRIRRPNARAVLGRPSQPARQTAGAAVGGRVGIDRARGIRLDNIRACSRRPHQTAGAHIAAVRTQLATRVGVFDPPARHLARQTADFCLATADGFDGKMVDEPDFADSRAVDTAKQTDLRARRVDDGGEIADFKTASVKDGGEAIARRADGLPAAVGDDKIRRGVITAVERVAVAVARPCAVVVGVKIQIAHELITAEIEAVPVVIVRAVVGGCKRRAVDVARIIYGTFITGAGEVVTHVVQIG